MSATPAPTSVIVRQRLQGKPPWRHAVDVGLASGIAALLIALVGMIASFSKLFVLQAWLSSGQVLLLGVMLFAGYVATQRSRQPTHSLLAASGYGALAGLIVGLMVALLVLVASVLDLRGMLVNVSPTLLEVLTFEQGTGLGVALLLLAGALMGWLGGVLLLIPNRLSNAIVLALIITLLVALLRDIIRVVMNGSPATASLFRFLFLPNAGLTVVGALLIFFVPLILSLLWSNNQEAVRARVDALPPASRRGLRLGSMVLGLLFLLIYPSIGGRFLSEAANNVILLGVLMGLGLNIVVGFAGMLDLGYVGFFAIGAYTMGILTSPETGLTMPFWLALPFCVIVALLSGILLGIPVLKMRGDYLAIVTLGFGEIIRVLLLSDWLRGTFNGASGIAGIPKPPIGFGASAFVLKDPQQLYFLLLATVMLTWFVSVRLRDSRVGRAWMAIREDEDVAEAMGIDLVKTKLLAFATGAAMAGLGGALFAAKLTSITPQSFNLLISVNALAIIIIGGLASIPGVIVGALLLIGLPEILREFADYRLWVYGALLVVMMLYRPEGFLPEEHIKRELHDFDNPEMSEADTVDSDLVSTATPGINDPVAVAEGSDR